MSRVVKPLKTIILIILTLVVIVCSPSLVTSVLSIPLPTMELKCGNFKEPCYLLLDKIQNLTEQGNLIVANEELTKIQPFLPVELKPIAEAIAGNIALRSGRYQEAINLLSRLINLETFQGNNRATLFYNLAQSYLERAYVYQQQGQPQNFNQDEKYTKLIASDRGEAVNLLREILSSASPESASFIKTTLKLGQLGEQISISSLHSAIVNYPQRLEKIEFLLNLAQLKGADSRLLYLEAIDISQQIDQPLGKSWAWGYWGEYLLKQGNYKGAITASIKAQLPIQSNPDWNLMARWQNLAAKAYEELGDKKKALTIYEQAIFSINQLRKDLAGTSISPESIDQIQNILRNYLELLLDPNLTQAQLKKATTILNLTALTEIERYFRSVYNLGSEAEGTQNKLNFDEALFYTAILNKQFYIIVELPDQTYHIASQPIQKEELNNLIIAWRSQLANPFRNESQKNGQLLYDLIITPISSILDERNIKYLTFINDGLLRNVSIGALFDGNQYLVENYSLSYSLGVNTQNQKAFPTSFLIVNAEPNLSGIEKEVQQISLITGSDSFVADNILNLSKNINRSGYALLHLATHSKFSGLIEETTIFIGNQDVKWNEFEQFLRSFPQPLTYLNLSSCETAQGNEYAVLGLTGLGLRTGISSVLGSLWRIDDEVTADFMGDFYSNWKTTNNIEKALQLAQIKRIKENNQLNRPVYWSGFIILR